jgi:hypothetical protein
MAHGARPDDLRRTATRDIIAALCVGRADRLAHRKAAREPQRTNQFTEEVYP